MEKKRIEIDTGKNSVKCEGVPMKCVKQIMFKWTGGQYPTINIDHDAEVSLSGIMITGQVKKMECSCGYYVGEFIGQCSDVICASCGKIINC